LRPSSRRHTVLSLLLPWWMPARVRVTRRDVRRYWRTLKWKRLEITGGAREELERLRREVKTVRRYSVTRLAALIAMSKIAVEGSVILAGERDPRIEGALSPVEEPDWRRLIKEEGLVEEVKDVTEDETYAPWRKFVEKAARRGANGRIVLRRPNGESVVIALGHPTVIAPAYEEVKDEELKLERNETNLPDEEVIELLKVAFNVKE